MSGLVPAYRPRASALHAAGAGPGAAFCAALALPAVAFAHPLVLAAAAAAVLVAARGARVTREVKGAGRAVLPVAGLVAVVNPLVSSEGQTLLVRGATVLGHRFDVTLEAVAAGAVAGGRIVVLVLAFALFSAAVDPDATLRALRRLSFRSALTASLATRLVPTLVRDAGRREEAARCRATSPGRVALARAALAGALDRSVEVAAAREVRGYGGSGRPGPGRERRSRHDRRLLGAAAALAATVVGARAVGVGAFSPYPRLELVLGGPELALAIVLGLLACAPFLGRAARVGVARA